MAAIAFVERMPKAASEPTGWLEATGAKIWAWMARSGENSRAARAAESFARLNALSDAELARKGIQRADLFWICYGRLGSL